MMIISISIIVIIIVYIYIYIYIAKVALPGARPRREVARGALGAQSCTSKGI